MMVWTLFRGRLAAVDETQAQGYVNIQNRYVVGSPVGDPLAIRFFFFKGEIIVVQPPTTYRTRDSSKVGWTDRSSSWVLTNAMLTGGMFGNPNAQGRYVIPDLSLRSTVPGVPAVMNNATLPVLFTKFNFAGWGMDASAKTGMVYGGTNSNMRFEEGMFFSGKPPAGSPGAAPAHDVVSENGANLEVAGCESHGTRGTLVATFRNPSVSGLSGGGVRLERWLKMNVDGRRVNSAGNWSGDMLVANFVQFINCANLPNSSVRKFILRNDPVYGAQFEDALSVFNSYCASGATCTFEEFLIENSMPTDPRFVASGGTLSTIGVNADGSEIGYAGTGGLMGDQQDIQGLTEATAAQGFIQRRGTILTVANYGAAIQAGHNNLIDDVKIVSAGVIRSKAPAGYSRMGWMNSGGFQIWDRTPNGRTYFHDDAITNGLVAIDVLQADGNYRPTYFEFYYPLGYGGTYSGTKLSVSSSPLASLARVDAYRAAQMQVWADAGTVIGCTDAAPFASIRISTDPF